jgi:hypothetical protein
MPSKKTKTTSEITVEPPASTEAKKLVKEGQEETTESPTSPTEKSPTSPTEKSPTEKKPRRASASVNDVYKPEELRGHIPLP